ncbi:unnamed protein product [Brassicogethes aeneus]|uniref:MADF domain-containing protein n=1 Tax=Brassicogethes aeneus TaxID=1431903 RepID=A0A9P0FDK0_BRAAE|nr:unnamed protein product [Brassicogethes aeneus]
MQKLQNLRTAFRKELRRVEESKRSGAGYDDIYVPKLWYYDLLLFTCDDVLPRASLESRKRPFPNISTLDTDVESENEVNEIEEEDREDNFANNVTQNNDHESQNTDFSERSSSQVSLAETSKSTKLKQ